jgi:type IV secretory pathway VirJ component
VALVGLENHAGFPFHLDDLIEDRHRSTDLDVGPELEAMRDLNVICIHGVGEKHAYCPGTGDDLMRVFEHRGGHRVSGTADGATSAIIIDQLGLRPTMLRSSGRMARRRAGRGGESGDCGHRRRAVACRIPALCVCRSCDCCEAR